MIIKEKDIRVFVLQTDQSIIAIDEGIISDAHRLVSFPFYIESTISKGLENIQLLAISPFINIDKNMRINNDMFKYMINPTQKYIDTYLEAIQDYKEQPKDEKIRYLRAV